jgi:hypothetical protein
MNALVLMMFATAAAHDKVAQATPVEGPWGDYVTFASSDSVVHAAWVDGDVLVASVSTDAGATWSESAKVSEGVVTGDAGQIRPRLVLAGGVPWIAFASTDHPRVSHLTSAGWTTQALDGQGMLLDVAVVDDAPFVVWLDGRRGKGLADVYGWTPAGVEPIYVDDTDGVCVCCRPAAGVMNDEPAVAFRDADGSLREIRLAQRSSDGWASDQVTAGGWALGGCPADGPRFDGSSVMTSDARDGRRKLYVDDGVLATGPGEAMQPRAAGGRRFWVEASKKGIKLLADGQVIATGKGIFEPGDPVVVNGRVWVPWQDAQGSQVVSVGTR